MFSVLMTLWTLVMVTPAQEKVTIHRKNPSVGDMQTKTSTFTTELNISVKMGGKEAPGGVQKETRKIVGETTVIAIGDSGVSKVGFTMVSKDASRNIPGMGEMSEKSDSAGKTFVVEKTDAGLSVTLENGEKASSVPTAEVSDVLRDGLFDPFERMNTVIPEGEIEVGKKLELPADLARGLLDPDTKESDEKNGLDVKSAFLTLHEVKDHNGVRCAVFDIVISAGGSPEGGMPMEMKITMEIAGQAIVAVDTGWLHSLEVKGPVEMSGSGGAEGSKVEISGKGELNFAVNKTFASKNG